jgi:hypothetical protein
MLIHWQIDNVDSSVLLQDLRINIPHCAFYIAAKLEDIIIKIFLQEQVFVFNNVLLIAMDIILVKFANIKMLIFLQVVLDYILQIEVVNNVSLNVLLVHMQIRLLNTVKLRVLVLNSLTMQQELVKRNVQPTILPSLLVHQYTLVFSSVLHLIMLKIHLIVVFQVVPLFSCYKQQDHAKHTVLNLILNLLVC